MSEKDTNTDKLTVRVEPTKHATDIRKQFDSKGNYWNPNADKWFFQRSSNEPPPGPPFTDLDISLAKGEHYPPNLRFEDHLSQEKREKKTFWLSRGDNVPEGEVLVYAERGTDPNSGGWDFVLLSRSQPSAVSGCYKFSLVDHGASKEATPPGEASGTGTCASNSARDPEKTG